MGRRHVGGFHTVRCGNTVAQSVGARSRHPSQRNPGHLSPTVEHRLHFSLFGSLRLRGGCEVYLPDDH